jgi:integrase/recombinase XerD
MQRVKNFAAFLGRSPDTSSFEDVRRYQLDLATSGAGVPTPNQSVSTLRFFFEITLGRADIVSHTQFIHVPRKRPVVLSPEEVARFLDAAPRLKYKAALSVAYGAGLRVSEVVALKVGSLLELAPSSLSRVDAVERKPLRAVVAAGSAISAFSVGRASSATESILKSSMR